MKTRYVSWLLFTLIATIIIGCTPEFMQAINSANQESADEWNDRYGGSPGTADGWHTATSCDKCKSPYSVCKQTCRNGERKFLCLSDNAPTPPIVDCASEEPPDEDHQKRASEFDKDRWKRTFEFVVIRDIEPILDRISQTCKNNEEPLAPMTALMRLSRTNGHVTELFVKYQDSSTFAPVPATRCAQMYLLSMQVDPRFFSLDFDYVVVRINFSGGKITDVEMVAP